MRIVVLDGEGDGARPWGNWLKKWGPKVVSTLAGVDAGADVILIVHKSDLIIEAEEEEARIVKGGGVSIRISAGGVSGQAPDSRIWNRRAAVGYDRDGAFEMCFERFAARYSKTGQIEFRLLEPDCARTHILSALVLVTQGRAIPDDLWVPLREEYAQLTESHPADSGRNWEPLPASRDPEGTRQLLAALLKEVG